MSYTVTYTHKELLNDTDNSRDKKECSYIIVLSNVQAVLKIYIFFFGGKTGTLCS